MPRTCTMCVHPDKAAIDQALLAGTGLRDIAGQYRDVSRSSLQRHKAHLPLVVTPPLTEVSGEDLLAKAGALLAKAEQILDLAEGTGKLTVALQAIREARECLALKGKLIGQLDDRPQVTILTSAPDWMLIRTRLMDTLAPYPAAKVAVGRALMELPYAGA